MQRFLATCSHSRTGTETIYAAFGRINVSQPSFVDKGTTDSDVRTLDSSACGRRSTDFLYPRTDSGSIAYEKLRARTDDDPVPLVLSLIHI